MTDTEKTTRTKNEALKNMPGKEENEEKTKADSDPQLLSTFLT